MSDQSGSPTAHGKWTQFAAGPGIRWLGSGVVALLFGGFVLVAGHSWFLALAAAAGGAVIFWTLFRTAELSLPADVREEREHLHRTGFTTSRQPPSTHLVWHRFVIYAVIPVALGAVLWQSSLGAIVLAAVVLLECLAVTRWPIVEQRREPSS